MGKEYNHTEKYRYACKGKVNYARSVLVEERGEDKCVKMLQLNK